MKADLAIVNRTFWPKSLTIGEGHFLLAKLASDEGFKTIVISEDHSKEVHIGLIEREFNFNLIKIKLFGDSSSSLVVRIIDTVLFSFWAFINLCLTRPKNVYVATDPPIAAPLMVYIYCKVFRAKYIYHYQDIHPEIANIVINLNPYFYKFLKGIDKLIQDSAYKLITINEEMKMYLQSRTQNSPEIRTIHNPATIEFDRNASSKTKGIVFCGNAGRLQRIPLLLKSISTYSKAGGSLPITFIGGGIYATEISKLASELNNVEYLGIIDANKCNSILSSFEWAILPIEDEITKYAFPSKTSAYSVAGSKIISICSNNTSVSNWVEKNKIGFNVEPIEEKIVDALFKIENNEVQINMPDKDKISSYFSPDYFAKEIFECLQL